MKFTPKFTEKDIRNFIRKKVEVLEDVIKDQLIDVAEEFVADARTINTYTDQTNNLRSSIGYVIIKDGNEIFGGFDLGFEINGTGKKGDGGQGIELASQLILEIQGDYPKGFALIVIAGMNYAVFVEAKGLDVLTGSSQTAETNLERQFDRLKESMKKVK